MTSFSPLEAILSSFNWSENSRAGQYAFNSAGGSSPCKRIDGESPGRYRTRVEAIRAAVQVLTRTLESTSASKAKEMAGVRRWLDKLFTMPDPDWMPEMAREAAQ
ncbi:putative pyridoxal phosphate biosynthetic protein PdxJ [Burkholderia pseudomallei]|nr:putative pyridoxal phosphate biosynthetic protein PdxJ [Burkholderia pseudomallei]